MKKLLAVTLLGATCLTGAAFAATQAELNADAGAIAKDNAAIAKQHGNIAVNRAEKSAAKVKGNVVDQASQSVQIGANKAAIQEKKAERHIDRKILAHDKAKAHVSANAAAESEMAPSAGSSPTVRSTNDIKTDTTNDTRN
jgi:hypothetical protein